MSYIVLIVLYLWHLLIRNGEMPFELIFPICVSWATWLLWNQFLAVIINYFSFSDDCHYPVAAIHSLSHIYLAVCLFLLPLQSWLNSMWTLALDEKRGKFSSVAWIYEAVTWFVVIGDGTPLWRAGLPPKGRNPCDLPSDTGDHKGFTARTWPGFIWRGCHILHQCGICSVNIEKEKGNSSTLLVIYDHSGYNTCSNLQQHSK